MNGIKLLSKTTLAEQAYHQIRELLLDQALGPGEVVGIDALAVRLGVSQTPIREALSRLEGDGLVVRLRSGRYRAAAKLGAKEFADLYAARLLLEPELAALAARNSDGRTLATLHRSVERMTKARTGKRSSLFVEFVDADTLFHQTIALGCGNDFLASAWTQLQANHRISPVYTERGVFDAAAVKEEHLAIAVAIGNGDSRAAASAMRTHIERSRDDVLTWIDAQTALDRSRSTDSPPTNQS